MAFKVSNIMQAKLKHINETENQFNEQNRNKKPELKWINYMDSYITHIIH